MKLTHAPSYYAATASLDSYPALDQTIERDVCVIGGGFSGVNTAIELAQRGHTVVLIEAGRIGWGATGRNGGQLIQGIGHDVDQFRNVIGEEGVETIRRLGVEAVDIVRRRIADHHISCDLTWGYCDLANKPSHVVDFKERLEAYHKAGYEHPVHLVEGSDLCTVVGSKEYLAGLVDMGSGHLHPLKLVIAEARLARKLGVKIFESTPASSVDVVNDTTIVTTPRGVIKAKRTVIACNAHIGGLEPTLSGKVLPAGSYIIATERLPKELAESVLPTNYAASDNLVGLNYFRRSADGRILFGGACHYSGRDPKDISAYMYPKMLEVFPQLKGMDVDYAWGGMIGIGANRFPQVGRLADKPQIYYAQAYAGHGVNASHLAAKIIAEAITSSSSEFDLFNSIPHMTFPGGKYFRSPLLALGMLWLRLKEIGR